MLVLPVRPLFLRFSNYRLTLKVRINSGETGPTSYVCSPQDLSVVRSPTSAGPKKGPGDLSVGPSVINRSRTIHMEGIRRAEKNRIK